MTKVVFRPVQMGDVEKVAVMMREIDALECRVFGHTPYEGLKLGVTQSAVSWTVEIDGWPEVILGVVPVSLVGGRGRPWLLGTPSAYKARRAFLSMAPEYVAKMEALFPRLDNLIAQRNRTSIRWLQWLGFVVEGKAVHYRGEPMLRFHKGF